MRGACEHGDHSTTATSPALRCTASALRASLTSRPSSCWLWRASLTLSKGALDAALIIAPPPRATVAALPFVCLTESEWPRWLLWDSWNKFMSESTILSEISPAEVGLAGAWADSALRICSSPRPHRMLAASLSCRNAFPLPFPARSASVIPLQVWVYAAVWLPFPFSQRDLVMHCTGVDLLEVRPIRPGAGLWRHVRH